MAMTPEELLLVQEELRRKREAEMAAPVAETNPLDAIIARKQKPDPLAEYDARIQQATDATPNIGQMIGAGFAGFGQSLAGGQGDYLDKTLKGIEAGRQRNITGATLAKTQFEEKDERDPSSNLSREFQLTAAEMTGRKPEELADMSAYDIKKVLPTLESRYKIKNRSEERQSEDRYRQDMINATRENRIAERGAKADEKEAKREEERLAREVPGFINTGKVAIPPTEAAKLREGVASFNTFVNKLQQYQQLVDKYGTGEVLNQDAAGAMDTLATSLQLDVKKLAQLGVLSKSDEPFIKKQIPDPGFFRLGGKMKSTLKTSENEFKSDVLQTLRARGYEPDEEMMKRLQSSGTPGLAEPTAPAPAAPATQYDDPEKERRYQEWKASQGR